jgi:caffeoyl-CoA O-methyltransferase
MIVNPNVERYLDSLEPRPDAVRRAMERRAARERFPIVGPQVGRLLAMLAASMRARRVLELGSGFGYSALWFARALPASGEVHLTDGSENRLAWARKYLQRAGLVRRARFHPGDALATLGRIQGRFDIVFNDVDKEQYPAVVDRAVEILRPGGLLITDNALWYGKVTRMRADPATRGVQEYNRRVFSRKDLDTVILPLRDGVALSRKKPT